MKIIIDCYYPNTEMIEKIRLTAEVKNTADILFAIQTLHEGKWEIINILFYPDAE